MSALIWLLVWSLLAAVIWWLGGRVLNRLLPGFVLLACAAACASDAMMNLVPRRIFAYNNTESNTCLPFLATDGTNTVCGFNGITEGKRTIFYCYRDSLNNVMLYKKYVFDPGGSLYIDGELVVFPPQWGGPMNATQTEFESAWQGNKNNASIPKDKDGKPLLDWPSIDPEDYYVPPDGEIIIDPDGDIGYDNQSGEDDYDGDGIPNSQDDDLDGDGIPDTSDTDNGNNGLQDWDELLNKNDPMLNPPTLPDSDHDGISDPTEQSFGWNPNNANSHPYSGWQPKDGLPGSTSGTSRVDTDGDGLYDVDEWFNGSNWKDPNSKLPDDDNDGWSNPGETYVGTNPNDPNSKPNGDTDVTQGNGGGNGDGDGDGDGGTPVPTGDFASLGVPAKYTAMQQCLNAMGLNTQCLDGFASREFSATIPLPSGGTDIHNLQWREFVFYLNPDAMPAELAPAATTLKTIRTVIRIFASLAISWLFFRNLYQLLWEF